MNCNAHFQLNITQKAKTMSKIVKRTQDPFHGWFDDFFTKDWFGGSSMPTRWNKTIPAVNVSDLEHAYQVEVAAPGLNKGDFSVEIEHGVLTISTEKQEEQTEEKDHYTRREFSYSSFKRSFTLPDNVIDEEKVSASYVDGILRITLPKKDEVVSPQGKKIEIQ